MSNAADLGYPEDDDVQEDSEMVATQQQQEEPQRAAPEPAAAPAIVRPKRAPIPLNKRGVIVPTDMVEEFRIAEWLLSTGMVPSCFKTPAQVALAVQICRVMGVAPSVAIRQLMIVPKANTIAAFGELPKAACERHIKTFDEFPIDQEYERICYANKNLHQPVWGYVARVVRAGSGQERESFFTLAMATKAGLFNRKESPWLTYPDRMLQMRARSRVLKDVFPDVLSGVAIGEYDFDMLDGKGAPSYGKAQDAKGQELADEIAALGEEEAAQ